MRSELIQSLTDGTHYQKLCTVSRSNSFESVSKIHLSRHERVSIFKRKGRQRRQRAVAEIPMKESTEYSISRCILDVKNVQISSHLNRQEETNLKLIRILTLYV